YKIIYSSTENDAARTNELIQLFRSRQVDAYIISPVQGTEKIIQELLGENKPVVLFDRFLPSISANYVGVDHFRASYEAIDGFVAMNKRNISLVTVDLDVEQITDRQAGYQQALADHHLAYNSNLVLKVPFNQPRNETIDQLIGLFKANETIDAVLFATNYLAISGLSALRSMNKLVNENFNVIAYDDGDVFKLHSPQISAVAQPLEEIADNIIKLIFKQLASTNVLAPEQIILPAKLIIR
ncbi:substrate-binding domain-containing protein, partial [Pedobacter sp.]|uniref:substrate-binding domain-containing protein n=1 Tax=Pedobacter sp. TaxID=1411316 RepID=UPI003D7F5CFD